MDVNPQRIREQRFCRKRGFKHDFHDPGETIGGDPQAVPILIGLGVDELSVSVPAIPTIKAQVRRLSHADCQELARRALNCSTGAEVRALLPETDH